MDNRYDVIVIGAGNGGLAAGAKTAKHGLRTLVLEKHNIPGGCASSFRRGRFEFEPSLHELCGVGKEDNPGSVYKIFKDLGADINWCYENDIFRVIADGPDGYDATLNGTVEGFCDSLEALVPGCRDKVKAMMDLYPFLIEAQGYASEANVPLKLFTKYKDFVRLSGVSAEELMDEFEIPKKAQNIINTYWSYLGVPTDELSAVHFLNMLSDYVIRGAAMPKHRSHELSIALVDSIKKNGGDVFFNTPVTKLIFNNDGKAIGVTAGGKNYFAEEIISNIIPDAIIGMSDKKYIPEHTQKLSAARKLGISVATMYIGLDCSADELGLDNYTIFVEKDPYPRKQFEQKADLGLYIVNCLNRVIPDSSPEGTCTLFFTTPICGDDLPRDLTPREYKKYKNDLAERMISDFEKRLGINIKDHIEEISIATPVTFARYLGTPNGTIYGYETSKWDNIVLRIAFERLDFKIDGLTFCGGHHTRGDGYSSSYFIGFEAGKKVVAKLKGDA